MPRKSVSHYPANWKEIARQIKEQAGWRCVRCGHAHDPKAGRTHSSKDLTRDEMARLMDGMNTLRERRAQQKEAA